MNFQFIRICSGCGKNFPKLETQLDGKDYCSTECFMEYNDPCEDCGAIIPVGEGVRYKEEGYALCWKCACGEDSAEKIKAEVKPEPKAEPEPKPQKRISLYEKNRNAVYATGNKWAIENWNATH